MFEIQSKWVAAVLSGRITLPSPEMMMEDLTASYTMLEALGIPKRHTHKLGKIQSKYLDWISEECGCQLVEPWRKKQVDNGYGRLVSKPENYRDEWNDDDLIKEAYEDFASKKLISSLPSYFPES